MIVILSFNNDRYVDQRTVLWKNTVETRKRSKVEIYITVPLIHRINFLVIFNCYVLIVFTCPPPLSLSLCFIFYILLISIHVCLLKRNLQSKFNICFWANSFFPLALLLFSRVYLLFHIKRTDLTDTRSKFLSWHYYFAMFICYIFQNEQC